MGRAKQNTINLGMSSKKESPYGGTLSQLGREKLKMSLPQIPFY